MNQIYQKFNQLQMAQWEKGDWQGDRDSMTHQSKVDPSSILITFITDLQKILETISREAGRR